MAQHTRFLTVPALPDWIDAHVHAFAAIGGVPRLLVPDNTKTAVIKACLYDPQVNRTYAEMAAHYATAIPPARPRRPRDKAKVEQAVLIVERWLLGRLCRRTFHSLAEVNAAIGEPLMRLNEARPIRRLGVTRRKLLEEIDRPALKVLPIEPYEYCEWRACRVGVDYHVDAGLPLLQRALSLRPRRGRRAADRALFQKLGQGDWIDTHDNLALVGPTGVGKSFLAAALGHKACRDNRSVLYYRWPKLREDLALARRNGRHPRIPRSLGRADLLILDDWGLEPLDASARHDLLEILEERYGRRSTIVTSQLPLDCWHQIIGDPTYADAILDRLVHNAHRIQLSGESLRRTRPKQAQKG
jgi:hypothetical protein